MNVIIEQFAQQCTEYITGTIDGDIEKFDYKKFAVLIITESIKASAISFLDNQYGNREDCIIVGSDIAAHFGLD